MERADVRVIDLTREQVGNRDRDDRGVNSIIVMTMSWSGVNRGQGDWVDQGTVGPPHHTDYNHL